MSALEIVLVSLLGGLILVFVFYLLIFHTNKNNRLETFAVINEDAKPNSIVFFGDSLTDFYPIQDFFPTFMIYNRGIAGDTTKDLLKRLHNIIAIKPRKIFIQIGTNDLGKNVKPIQIIANIKTIYTRLQNEVPGIEIIAISLYPVSHHKIWLSPFIAGIRTNKNIVKTNMMLKALCDEMGITYIDIHEKLSNKKGRLDSLYTLEGLHISGLGYAVISQALCDYVKK